jgi:long-chain acyl-CoA synthetase
LFDLLLSIKGGAKRVFCNDVNGLAEAMFEKKATYVGGVPALYDVLFEEIKSLDEEKQKAIRENIKFLFSAGAPLKIETLNNFKELGIQILQGYGLTETSSAIALETLSENKVGSVGKVLDGIELKLINKDKNGAGEIIVKSDSNYAGAIDKDGFLHTGDVGTVDEEGYLFIVGRNKNMIVLDNGKKVFPEQLEGQLNAIDGIKESLVYGESNKIKAIIVCDDGENALKAKIDALNGTLPDFKQIKEVKYTNEPLPRTKTQKLIRDFKVENDKSESKVSNKNKSIEERIKEIISEVLKKDISEIELQSKIYEDLRADSLDTISINIKLEKELGEKIPREDSKGFIAVEDIVRYFKNKKDE